MGTTEAPGKAPETRAEMIARARKILNKAYKADVTYLMSDVASARDRAVPLGIPAIDWGLLGIGGLPRGHFVEVSGAEKVGKTTFELHAIAACQRQGIIPLVIDPKGAVSADVPRARRIGVEPSECIIVPVDSSEEALTRTRVAVGQLRQGGLEIAFFWDDMGLTPTDAEVSPKFGKDGSEVAQPGDKARVMWRFCRALAGECYRQGALMLVVNQLTAVIAQGWAGKFAEKETTAGGGGLKYTARIRIELRRGKSLKQGDAKVGHIVYAKTTANAFFPPFQSVQLHLNYRDGYLWRESTMLNAEDEGVVRTGTGKKNKGLLSVPGTEFQNIRPVDVMPDFLIAAQCKLWPWINDPDAVREAVPVADFGADPNDPEVAEELFANDFSGDDEEETGGGCVAGAFGDCR